MNSNKSKLLDILNLSAKYLQNHKIENARLNAELLISHALNLPRIQIYVNFDKPLSEQELENIRSLLKRRAGHEPVQYIIGETEFYSLKFKINNHTLIPRPETELLVEKIIEKCSTDRCVSILDIGTGSGNIAISLAKNIVNSTVTGIDIKPEALKVASENAVLNDVNNRINFTQIDIFDTNISQLINQKFDIIVSNPPYIPQDEYQKLPLEVKNFEPKEALLSGSEGLDFYKHIAQIARLLLNTNGFIAFEMSYNKSEQIKKILLENNFTNIIVNKDLNEIDRIISAKYN